MNLSYEEIIDDQNICDSMDNRKTKSNKKTKLFYYCIDGKVYSINEAQEKNLNCMFDRFSEEDHSDRLQWIEQNGKYIINCEVLAY